MCIVEERIFLGKKKDEEVKQHLNEDAYIEDDDEFAPAAVLAAGNPAAALGGVALATADDVHVVDRRAEGLALQLAAAAPAAEVLLGSPHVVRDVRVWRGLHWKT